jgi:YD repeat-containing protein
MTRQYKYDGARRHERIELDNEETDDDFNSDGVVFQITYPASDVVVQSSTHKHENHKQTTTQSYSQKVDRYAAFDGTGRIEYELFDGATKEMKFAYDDLGRVIADTIQAVTITGCSEEIEFEGFLCSGGHRQRRHPGSLHHEFRGSCKAGGCLPRKRWHLYVRSLWACRLFRGSLDGAW